MKTRVLILGSLPGAASLVAARYYAHPRNHFWALLGSVIRQDLPSLAYANRLDALLHAGVGLWDVIGSAARKGSLDSSIGAAKLRDLAAFAASLPALRAVAFNGARAAKYGVPLLAGQDLQLLVLPSSSAALARPLAWKQQQWRALAPFLALELHDDGIDGK
jgi:hypoxanthine-DNA glycosylase